MAGPTVKPDRWKEPSNKLFPSQVGFTSPPHELIPPHEFIPYDDYLHSHRLQPTLRGAE